MNKVLTNSRHNQMYNMLKLTAYTGQKWELPKGQNIPNIEILTSYEDGLLHRKMASIHKIM